MKRILVALIGVLAVALAVVSCLALGGCGEYIRADGTVLTSGPTKTITFTDAAGHKITYIVTGMWDTKIGVLDFNPVTGQVHLENFTADEKMSQNLSKALDLANTSAEIIRAGEK